MSDYIRQHILSAFSDLTFDEKKHLYFWKRVRVEKSVSALVEDHAEEFDANKVLSNGKTLIQACAYKASREEGRVVTEHELKHRWQTTNIEACELGTETHDFLEHYDGLITPTTPQQKAGVKFLLDILKEYEIVAREVRMYSKKFKYAGTADLLLRHKATGKYVLADYKTNKDLFKTYGLLLPPFQYLEDHPYNHYQLQLSYYQMMLEEIAVPISERIIVYLKADGEYKTYNTIDFTSYLTEYLTNKKVQHAVSW